MRKGKITLEVTKMLSKEELQKMDATEVSSIVSDKLDYNAYKYQEEDKVIYKNGNSIEGLENVLYWCPKCDNEFTIKNASFDTMKCSHCGNEVYLDKYGFLNKKNDNDVHYKYVSDWYLEIYNRLKEEVSKNSEYKLNENVVVHMLNYKKHKFEPVGRAKLELNKDNFIIDGIINDENKLINVPIKTLPILPFKPGKQLEIQDGSVIYRCVFDNGQAVSKWINLLKIYYEINNEKDSI